MLAQNARLIGVMKMASTLEIAVKLTERAILPFANAEKKLEMLPPGQAATIIMPNAKLGLGSNNQIIKNVRKRENNKLGESTPTKVPRGFASTILKSSGVSLSATPNMIIPRLIFRMKIFSSEKLRVMLSIDSISNPER